MPFVRPVKLSEVAEAPAVFCVPPGLAVTVIWVLTFVNLLGVRGAGRVQLVTTALKVLPLVAIGIAKKEELIFTRDREEPIAFAAHGAALRLLQRIRDEAHRFAVTFHRRARTMRDLRSELDLVPGIGPRRRRTLLTTFGSLAGVRRATREELEAVAERTQVRCVEIEVRCSDLAEHRRRVETRAPDIVGAKLPTWEDVVSREYHTWNRPHVVIDTSRGLLACATATGKNGTACSGAATGGGGAARKH